MTKKEVKSYLRNNKLDIQHANASYFVCDLVFSAYSSFKSICGVTFNPIFASLSYENNTRIDFYQIISEKAIRDTAQENYREYLKDPKILEKQRVARENLEKELDRVYKKYQSVNKKHTSKEFSGLFKQMIYLAREWWYYGAIGEDKGDIVSLVIVPAFSKRHKISLTEARDIINTLSYTEKRAVFNLERRDFLEMCRKTLAGEKISRNIKSYINKYFWFKTNFYKAEKVTPENLFKEVTREISTTDLVGIKKEMMDMEANLNMIEKKRKELLSELTLTEEDKKDVYFAREITGWIDDRKMAYMKQFFYLFSFVQDTAEREKIFYHDLVIYAVDEFANFLETGERLSAEEIKNRRKGIFVVWGKEARRQVFYGEDAKELLEHAISFKHEGDIKGQVASTGGVKTITGKIRIIHRPAEEEFNKEEILVTSMTRVEFVSLMRKAKAIITDEGGIACHAAIVSRELGIPCIIGTKIATKVLKDGDLVEVNADEGIVKILKRA